tara:strand:+ start:209 stop:433 length:225 start_codon:yes stop_codon:yes gene_type:complete
MIEQQAYTLVLVRAHCGAQRRRAPAIRAVDQRDLAALPFAATLAAPVATLAAARRRGWLGLGLRLGLRLRLGLG